MALDNQQARMASQLLSMPFRGPMVATEVVGFDQEERQASAFQYSGILASDETPVATPVHGWNRIALTVGIGV